MARDQNAKERIESILHHSGLKDSGDTAEQVYDEEVQPLIDSLQRMILMHEGLPMTGIEAGKWVKEAMDIVQSSSVVNESLVRTVVKSQVLFPENDISYVETDRGGADTWVMKDGSRVKPPEGWTNEIEGGLKATKISEDGKTELKPLKSTIKPGNVRCMDCRCDGVSGCPGESREQQAMWRAQMSSGM